MGKRYKRSMTLPNHPWIAVDPDICGGRPTVAGTRVRVTDVLEMLAGGAREAEIMADLPYLTLEDIRACLDYDAAASGILSQPTELHFRRSRQPT